MENKARIAELANKMNPSLKAWTKEYGSEFVAAVLLGAVVDLMDKARGRKFSIGVLYAAVEGLEEGLV